MKAVFAAGGTGGHINPALSAAQELRSRYPDAEILFVGTKDKMEAQLVPKAGFDFTTINISGFQRSFAPADIVYNLGTLKKLLFVTSQCKKILTDFRPDVVIGFGGYVSGPVVRTAHKLGIKTAIHEQNAFPGKTNIALSKYADAVMLTSENAEKYLKCAERPYITGLPVREELLCADRESARRTLSIPDDVKLVLSTGGSLGAESINNVMCDIISGFSDEKIRFIHGYGQLGRFVPDRLREKGIVDLDCDKRRVTEYIYDMAVVMAAADLVISRAGASSLAEIQALGKASVLIPYPFAAENHQYHNAMALVEKDAAILIDQKELTSDRLASIIRKLLAEPSSFEAMGKNARNMAKTDAKKRICDIIVGLTE